MAQIRSDHEPGERYIVLRIIGGICTAIGALFLVAGTFFLVYGIYAFLTGPTGTPGRGGAPFAPPPASVLNVLSPIVILWALGAIGAGLEFMAMGYLIRLAIQVEENTRTSAHCLEKLCARVEPRTESPGSLFVS
ncbi:hypothetical protein V5E97_00615 [Singulisphaera sp. Ch08]|uniref:DUF3566 domain-containing protein n=1 Tax=Singulisphaera sp. Ch08 TaxID=3120278 RepID=A0AAU7CGR4_9BACT